MHAPLTADALAAHDAAYNAASTLSTLPTVLPRPVEEDTTESS
jgi:hypothetical protein